MDFNKLLESFAEIPAKVEEAKKEEDEMDDDVQEEEHERSSSERDYDRSLESGRVN